MVKKVELPLSEGTIRELRSGDDVLLSAVAVEALSGTVESRRRRELLQECTSRVVFRRPQMHTDRRGATGSQGVAPDDQGVSQGCDDLVPRGNQNAW